jgi:glycerophosphoryl diester phosphodiesterase
VARRACLYALVCIAVCAPTGARAGDSELEQCWSRPCVAAHRGGFPFADSNTLARFDAAWRGGADIVETDLRVSRDGVVFLFHDRDLSPSTSCTGPLAEHSAAEIDACRLKGLSVGPDRFESALAWARGRVVIDAELKSAAVVRPAIDLVRRYHAYEWVYFQVRNGLDLYREVRAYDARVALEAAPEGPRGELYLDELLAQRDSRLLVIQLHPESLTDENLLKLRAGGKLVSIDAWRVGEERTWALWPFLRRAACRNAWSHGVDIAVTNVPEDCARQRGQVDR